MRSSASSMRTAGVGDDALGGDQPLDLTADVRGVPRRAAAASRASTRSTAPSRSSAPTGVGVRATGPAGSR